MIAPRRLRGLIVALGIAQIVSWGPLFYAIAVLWPAIAGELGLSKAFVFGIVSLSLFVNGVMAPAVGRFIDRRGGRVVMASGSVLAAVAMALLAGAAGPVQYVIGWVLGGAAMSMTLYDPAFATISQHSGAGHRRALTAITLFGGFASTVFWPLTAELQAMLGWRGVFAVYALLQLLVCLPLHALVIPSRNRHGGNADHGPQAARPAPGVASSTPEPRVPGHDEALWREPAIASSTRWMFRLLALSFALVAFNMSSVAMHLLAMLQARGLSLTDAVVVGSVIGPMQVAGRLVDIVLADRVSPLGLGRFAMVTMVLAMLLFVVLPAGLGTGVVFAALYGAGMGLQTIVKGLSVAELFGRERYGLWLGRLGRWVFTMHAAAPFAFAGLLASGVGYERAAWALLAVAVAATLCFSGALRLAPKRRAH